MKWTNTFLDKKRHVADPIADNLINQLVERNGKGAAQQIFEKLIRNIDLPINELPEEIKEFLQQKAELPAWLSKKDLSNSYLFFTDHGPKCLLILYFKSLPLLYSDAKGAQVLVNTSRLTNQNESLEIFARRIAETGQFLLNVMTKDGFEENGLAINSARKVRLIHAAIRHFIGDHWEESTFGKPINQEDLVLTLLTFSISLIDGLKQLSITEKGKLIKAYYARWKAIGILLGIDEDLIPDTIEEGRMLLNIILERNAGSSDAGKLLTKSLINFSKNSIPGKVFDITPEILISFFTGHEISAYLGINNNSGCLGFGIPAVITSILNLGEMIEGNPERVNYVANKISVKLMRGMVKYFDQYKERNFEVPSEFKSVWRFENEEE